MAYKTRYKNINNIEIEEAFDIAKEYDRDLKGKDGENTDILKLAIISLARRVRELELEWS